MNRIGQGHAGILILLIAVIAQLAPRSARGDQVDDYINAEMRKRHIPGVALAVLRKGEVVKTGTYGLANVELNVPVSANSVFQIQSVTKQFTATEIMLLVEEGKVSLSDPVSKHLDGTPESWKEITIRHLLNHTSGIKDFINEPTASLRLDVSEEQVLKATAPRALNFKPGEKYAYSNTNYHLLAMIIRKHTGKWYGQVLKERIFEPMGMSSTRVQNLSEVIPNRAAGYQFRDNKLRNGDYIADSILSYGGGGVLSTIADMARWDAALYGEKLLKKPALEQMWTKAKFNDGKESGYGLGWGVGGEKGHRWVSHSGAHMTGFTSNIVRFLDDELDVIVLTNAGHANPGRMARNVAGTYVPALKPAPEKAIEDKEPKVADILKKIVGQVSAGKLDKETFTPQLYDLLAPLQADLQADSKRDGELKKIELLSHNDDKDERNYRYRLTFANRVHLISLTLDKADKVSGLEAEEE